MLLSRLVYTCYHLSRTIFWTFVGIMQWFVPNRFRIRKSIKNDVILLTGAGSGLGRQIALRLAAKGAKMVLWDVNKRLNEETERMIRQKGGQAKSYVCDITDRQAVYETAAKVKNEVGQITILVNNAGIYQVRSLMNLDDKGIVKTMETNALSNIWTTKAVLPDMMAQNKGHIVAIASISGLIGAPTQTDYCASKHAAIGFMEALRAELDVSGYPGIRTTIVCPYFFDSGLYKGLGEGLLAELKTEEVAKRAVGAILIEKSKIIIPGRFRPFVILLSLLPQQAKSALGDVLRIKQMLQSIQSGRTTGIEKNGAL